MFDPQEDFTFTEVAWCPRCRDRQEIEFCSNAASSRADGDCPVCDTTVTLRRDEPRSRPSDSIAIARRATESRNAMAREFVRSGGIA